MKKSICLAASLLALNLTPGFGQPAPAKPQPISAAQLPAPPSAFAQRLRPRPQADADAPALTKFNLDFPGGTPKELVAAIEKAMGKPLNAIISTEDADLQMPPLKMNDVDVARLFRALESASLKQVQTVTGTYFSGPSSSHSYSTFNSGYGFKTEGEISDNSVWFFHVEKPALPPVIPAEKVCRFYQLAPYLERGLTVDDITTAIQTGWKMMGDISTPEISFHKETKLLMAVGEPDKLEVIDNVLRALQPASQPIGIPSAPRLPRFGRPSPSTLSPEAQVLMIEKNRLDSQQSANPMPPTPLTPQPQKLPVKPEAGQ
jgi:hypothetical protein